MRAIQFRGADVTAAPRRKMMSGFDAALMTVLSKENFMGIIKQEDGRYLVDLRPKGISGRRIRRIFQRKSEAVAFQRHVQAHAESLEWAGGPSDRRLLSGLLDAWWLLHGQTMENGATERRHLQKRCGIWATCR